MAAIYYRDKTGKFVELPIGGVSDSQIEESVKKYLIENPVEITETDPTVPNWAKQPNKPTYTADEVGAYTKKQVDTFHSNYIHKETYDVDMAKKEDKETVELQLFQKADKSNTYTKSDVNTMFTALSVQIGQAEQDIETKVNSDFVISAIASRTYTKTEVESKFSELERELNEEAHFRGYLSTNAKIQALQGTPNDFAYSAESGTKWVYYATDGWKDTEQDFPNQSPSASDTIPLMDGDASVGTEEVYARGDHVHPHDVTRVSEEYFNQIVDEIIEYVDDEVKRMDILINGIPSSETILYEDVVNTPEWENQPGAEGSLDSAFNTDSFYYVTLKDADGNALPSGEFMLKDTYTDGATVYPTVFILANLNTGTATLVENYPVEFISVGSNYKLRDAGITSYVQNTDDLSYGLDISNGTGSIRIVVNGEVIPRNTNLYVYSQFKTDKNVASYHSTNGTTAFQSSSTKDIVGYTNLTELNNVGNIFYDSTVLTRGESGYFSLERNVVIRYNENYKNAKAYQVFGFGKTLSKDTNIASIAVRLNNTNNGMIRNGTKIIVSEVK